MSLADRLVEAGLVTRDLISKTAQNGAGGGALARQLVELGIEADALVGFFVAAGYGPIVTGAEVLEVDSEVLLRLPPEVAWALCAMPVRSGALGLVVAMADPSDYDAVATIRRTVGVEVLPAVARVTELDDAMSRLWPQLGNAGPRKRVDTEEGVAIELVQRRAPAGIAREETASYEQEKLRPHVETIRAPGGMQTPAQGRRRLPTGSYERPPPAAQTVLGEGEDDDFVHAAPRWSDLAPKQAQHWEHDAEFRTLRRSRPKAEAVHPPGEIVTVLSGLRATHNRDAVIRLLCQGALSVSRAVVFLALHQNTLRGWDGLGSGLSREGVRNLFIPATSPSTFRSVLRVGRSYRGPHGPAAADEIFRAATSSRGGTLLVCPLAVEERIVGLLCVDDLRYDNEGRARVEALVEAAAAALSRIIVEKKV